MEGFGNFKKSNVSFNKPLTISNDTVLDNETDNNIDNEIDNEIQFKILTGQKKKLLMFLIKNKSSSNPSITGPIMYSDISKSLKVSKESVPVLLSRLLKTGLVERYQTQYGRTGYAIFKYSPFIRKKFNTLR